MISKTTSQTSKILWYGQGHNHAPHQVGDGVYDLLT